MPPPRHARTKVRRSRLRSQDVYLILATMALIGAIIVGGWIVSRTDPPFPTVSTRAPVTTTK